MLEQISTSERFDEVVKNSEKLVVIDFHAPWCAPCKNIAKNIDEFANKYEDKVVIYKVNVDDSSDVAENAGVTGLPFFAFYKNGAQVGHIASSNTDTIEKKLISYL